MMIILISSRGDMKHTSISCDECNESVNSQYLEMLVHTTESAESGYESGTFDLCGVSHIHPKIDELANRVINGELISIKIQIVRKEK